MSNKINTTVFLYRLFPVVLLFALFSGIKTSEGREKTRQQLSIASLLHEGESGQKSGTMDDLKNAVFKGDSETAAVLPPDSVPFHTVRVALVQYDAVPEQPERNLKEMERLVRQAAAMGGRIVVFHEMSLSDYTPRVKYFAQRIPDGPACLRMGALARELNCFVSFGMPERAGKKDDERFHITQVFFGPKGYVYRYRKTWLWWDYEENDQWYRKEPSRYDPGTGPELFMIDGIAATCFICRDGSSQRCIERVKNLRPQLVFYPSNYRGGNPAASGGIARRIGAPLLIINRVGASWNGENKDCLGNTAAFDAQGNMLAKANVEGREEILIVEVPLYNPLPRVKKIKTRY